MDDIVSAIYDAHNEVMAAVAFNATEVMAAFTEGPGVFSGLSQFVGAVDWGSELAFKLILAFHVLLWAVALLWAARDSNRLMFTMALLILLVFAASPLNDWGYENHEFIFPATKVNYFDRGGVFISAVWSGPLVVLAFILQIRMIIMLAGMMVTVKRGQLREQQQQGQGQSKDGKGPATQQETTTATAAARKSSGSTSAKKRKG